MGSAGAGADAGSTQNAGPGPDVVDGDYREV